MKNKNLLVSVLLPSLIFVAILLLDLLTKHFIINLIPNEGDSMDVIPGFINFVHVQNSGAAWGVLAGRPVFLIIVSIIIMAIYLAFYIIRTKKHKGKISSCLAVSVGLIAGGCLGNLIDRIAFGYVRDFINFEFMDFPVFNFADVALTFGIIIMIIYFFFIYSKEEERFLKAQSDDEEKQSKITTTKIEVENEDVKIEENIENEEKIEENTDKNTKNAENNQNLDKKAVENVKLIDESDKDERKW